MKTEYDKYYQTENLFGDPYPALIDHYTSIKNKGKLLDLGCGQGRNAIPLARMGFEVTGIDHSKIGIEQLNEIAKKEQLPLKGVVGNIYEFSNFAEYNFVLLDSIFHFGKKELEKERKLLKNIINSVNYHTQITICIQNSGIKLNTLNAILSEYQNLIILARAPINYKFEDKASNHFSETNYEMITMKNS